MSSDPSRAGEASDTEVNGPVGALYAAPADGGKGPDGRGIASSPEAEAPGNGKARKQAAAVSSPAAEDPLSRLAARSIDRIDEQFSHFQEDAPACDVCGSITVRNGNCYKCFNCGSSLGCS